MLEVGEKAALLRELNEGISRCPDCALSRTRTRAVPGEGPPDARVMFIGEAPGYYEDQQGRPFVGAAGQFLEQLLAGIGLQRSDVFIANVVKCRPPGNRDPLPAEIQACSKWLDRQLEVIQPAVVVTLGRYSLNRFLPGAAISRVHGQGRWVNGRLVVPMYHPAAALHQASLRQTIEADFQKIPVYVQEAVRQPEPVAPAPPKEPEPQQMKLF
jgi:DNA polymerase